MGRGRLGIGFFVEKGKMLRKTGEWCGKNVECRRNVRWVGVDVRKHLIL